MSQLQLISMLITNEWQSKRAVERQNDLKKIHSKMILQQTTLSGLRQNANKKKGARINPAP